MTEPAAARPLDIAVSFVRFLLVGAVNTAVGLAVILGLQLGFNVPAQLANAGGYAVGLIVSFTLNRRLVFSRGGTVRRAVARYGMAALAGFTLNQLVLALADRLFGHGPLAAGAAQCVAVASYTAVLFGLCHGWVFREPPGDPV